MKYTELNLHAKVQEAVASQNYIDCTPIQTSAIPHVLSGHDIAGLAQTGTGKTAAFLVPLLDRIIRSIEAAQSHRDHALPKEGGEPSANEGASNVEKKSASTLEAAETAFVPPSAPTTQRPIFENWRSSHFVLVLVPTRELAEQVSENAVKLGSGLGFKVATIYGGTSYETQKNALKQGVQFIVATPGRLIDLYKEHLVDLNQVRAIVFDEADRMFDMGFKDDMKYILRRVPKDRQFLVFSATLNFDVLNTAYEFGANPVEINVSKDQAKAENVKDEIYHVGHYDKPQYLISLIQKIKPRQLIIFSNFKHNVERISQFLSQNSLPAMAISSLLTQAQRNRVMELFKAENEKNILVATDLAARGLDIKGVDLVINFELPDDPENYVHRIGRTGRASATGMALSLVGERDVEALGRIEDYLGHKIEIGWIEDAEVIKEFKPFPSEKRNDRPQRSDFSRGPRRDGRRDGGRDGQRDFARDGREGGRRSESSPRNSPHRDRTRSDDARHGSSPGDARHGENRRNDSKHRSPQGQRPFSSQNKNGPQNQKFKHRPQANGSFSSRSGAGPARQRPSTNVGLGQKISRFFKNLFGG